MIKNLKKELNAKDELISQYASSVLDFLEIINYLRGEILREYEYYNVIEKNKK